MSDGRRLTAGEVRLVREVFRSEIATGIVRIHNHTWMGGLWPTDRIMAPNGHIYYPEGNAKYGPDISQMNLGARATFIHEMVHVYQDQRGEHLVPRAPFEREYDYGDLAPGTKWADLNMEQQGNVVRDYYYLTQGQRTNRLPALSRFVAVIPWLPGRPDALAEELVPDMA